MNIAATELNKRPGTYLEAAMREPVVVEKAGRPSVVIVSYQHFLELEDSYWGHKAREAEKTAEYASAKESLEFLKAE